MRKTLIISLAATLAAVACGCTKDGELVFASTPEAVTISGPTGGVVLDRNAEDATAVTISWTGGADPTLSSSDAKLADGSVKKVLQFSEISLFKTVVEVSISSDETSRSFTNDEFNTIVWSKLGYTPDKAKKVFCRMKSYLGTNTGEVYSNELSFNVTPYKKAMTYAEIYNASNSVLGKDTGCRLRDFKGNGTYGGFWRASSWANFYVIEANNTMWGNLPQSGKPFYASCEDGAWNFWFPGTAGIYYAELNTSAEEWSALLLPSMTLTINGQAVAVEADGTEAIWTAAYDAAAAGDVTVNISGTGKLSDKSTGDSASTDKQFGFAGKASSLTFGTSASDITLNIPAAGSNVITIDLRDPAAWTITAVAGQQEDDTIVLKDGYVKGADISWITKMESEGQKFYNAAGDETECTAVIKEAGFDAVRYRVWVNPTDGWNAPADVLVKAKRAQALGMKIMIDFHYSDTWADPANQKTPEGWSTTDIDVLKGQLADHTKSTLQLLKDNGVDVTWVQVGNETNTGMCQPLGGFSTSEPDNFITLINAGYDAVKSVYPDAIVIVHRSNGHDLGKFTWMFDVLKSNSCRYDMIGMSLYPSYWVDGTGYCDWKDRTVAAIANISTLYSRYGKPVMIVETGMPVTEPTPAKAMMHYLLKNTGTLEGCSGVFYWEPEAESGYNDGYNLGAFKDGRPTEALDPFKE